MGSFAGEPPAASALLASSSTCSLLSANTARIASGEEVDRFVEIGDRKVDEDLPGRSGCHVFLHGVVGS
jgi:hypothetical protein